MKILFSGSQIVTSKRSPNADSLPPVPQLLIQSLWDETQDQAFITDFQAHRSQGTVRGPVVKCWVKKGRKRRRKDR